MLKDQWLFISALINTLARADLYLITSAFALWMKSFAETEQERKEADAQVFKFETIFFGIGVITTLFYGYMLDKHKKTMKVVYPTLIVGMIGYMFIFFAENEKSAYVILLVVFSGGSMPGFFNSGNYLSYLH